MKLATTALASLTTFIAFGALASLTATGCAAKTNETSDEGNLGTSEAQLVADDQEADDTDSNLETGVDEPLSGATEADPGTPADGATDAELLEKVKANAGKFFKPAGCITTTIDGNTATHVFKGCTGPYGLASFNGTVVSTYVRADGKLTITHEAQGFAINGATISGSRTVVYTRSGTTITKTRTGNWSGTTAKGKPISHQANFVTTYDASTKCITRDGSAQTSVGGREHERSITDYKRCGVGSLGCPESGEIVLSKTKSGDTMSLTIDFLGGTAFSVTGPNGKSITLQLVCQP